MENTQYKIISWNVANAANDEKTDGRFGRRFDSQIEFLANEKPDIIMLQEIRICKDVDGITNLTPLDIAYRYAKRLHMEIAGLCPINTTEMSFWRLTLYNPKRLWMSNCIPVRTFDTDLKDHTFTTDFGYLLLFNQFAPCESNVIMGSKSFWTCNIHFPLKLNEKMIYIDVINSSVEKICHGQQVIISGDCNVFMDNGGQKQLNKMMEYHFEEHTKHIDTTFKSFPWDNFQTTSHLDYVFTKNPVTLTSENIEVVNVSATDISSNQISDHYPIIINTKII